MIFRIDDINKNTDFDKLLEYLFVIRDNTAALIMLCISVLSTRDKTTERVFPKIYKAYSNHKVFFEVDQCFNPIEQDWWKRQFDQPDLLIASHGLIHIDHRLLSREGQEMSIVVASSLTRSKIFVPPFHKWNNDTEAICSNHHIDLIKFEDGWEHVLFNPYFHGNRNNYYFHPFDLTPEQLNQWFKGLK